MTVAARRLPTVTHVSRGVKEGGQGSAIDEELPADPVRGAGLVAAGEVRLEEVLVLVVVLAATRRPRAEAPVASPRRPGATRVQGGAHGPGLAGHALGVPFRSHRAVLPAVGEPDRGAVLGVGLARGIEAIDLRVVVRIFVSWVVTIPAGAFLAIVFFFLFKTFLP